MTADALSALRMVPGVDVDFGLGIVRTPSAYIKLLKRFAGERRHIDQQFLLLLDAGRQDEAQHLAHTLKGTASFFGLTKIQSQADALEAAIRNDAHEDSVIGMIVELGDAIACLEAAIRG